MSYEVFFFSFFYIGILKTKALDRINYIEQYYRKLTFIEHSHRHFDIIRTGELI